MSDDLKQLVPTDDDLRPTVLLAMDLALGRIAILEKSMQLLHGKANPAQVLKVIDEELKRKP